MITINDISARIAGRLLIDHATVALPAGTKAGLVGKNGAGKSTLFRIITGDLSRKAAISRSRKMRGSVRWLRKHRAPKTR